MNIKPDNVIEVQYGIRIINSDCFDALRDMPDNSVDSCITDPPYGISFMNKHWDYQIPSTEIWKEVLRVLKPGAHLLCACGTRTQHRMAVNIEDAGFEIRDVITWHYASGFPKSQNISKAIDKQAGAERKVIGVNKNGASKLMEERKWNQSEDYDGSFDITEPATYEAKLWDGWGTALKPATEFWTLARKPLSEKTIADNVLKHSTGAINIDAGRIATEEKLSIGSNNRKNAAINFGMKDNKEVQAQNELGRFPANVIFDEQTGKILDEQTGILTSGKVSPDGFKGEYKANVFGKYANNIIDPNTVYGDSGGASRFFYCPKTSASERNKGLEDFDKKAINHIASETGGGGGWKADAEKNPNLPRANHHPTVKPIALMRYLVKLITPKSGTVLDPFNGSGSTGIAAKLELMHYVGIEMEEEYCKISAARIAAWNVPNNPQPELPF